MLTISFNGNKVLWDFFTDLTLPDIVSVTFGLIIHFFGIQKCSLSYAYCFPMLIPAHTHIIWVFNYLPLCSHKTKYTDKANYMSKNIFNPSLSSSVPDDITREQDPYGQETL